MNTVISKIKLETGTSCHCQWRAKAGAPLKETVSPSSVTLTCSVPHTHPIGTKSQLAKQMGGLQNSVITESKRLGVELVVVVHSLSHVWLFVTPWTAACQAFLSFTISWSLLNLMSIESVMPSSVVPYSSFNLSQHQGLSNESVLQIRWPEYWSFSFSISPSSDYSGRISFRIDWLDFVAVQGTLRVFCLFYTWWRLWWFAAAILGD